MQKASVCSKGVRKRHANMKARVISSPLKSKFAEGTRHVLLHKGMRHTKHVGMRLSEDKGYVRHASTVTRYRKNVKSKRPALKVRNVRVIMTRKTRKTRRTSREFKRMHPSPPLLQNGVPRIL